MSLIGGAFIEDFVRVAVAVPICRPADCDNNADEIIKIMRQAAEKQVQIMVFPELCITGATCGDMFMQDALKNASEAALQKILRETADLDLLAVIGIMPEIDYKYKHIISCAVCACKGEEIYKAYNTGLLQYAGLQIRIETGRNIQNIEYADVILSLNAQCELIDKDVRSIVAAKSAGCVYAYANAGTGESTTDAVYSGHSFIYENCNLLCESEKFKRESFFIYADCCKTKIISHPFIPKDKSKLEDVFSIQAAGLAKRLEYTQLKRAVINISGGLDSTLALISTVKAFDYLNKPRKDIIGLVLRGFGTTERTYKNALELIRALNISYREIPIIDACIQHFKDIGHDPEVKDLTFENVQARKRTQILMDIAYKENGLAIGTGNMSELALGWCTYNGDHMSMYALNAGITKTLVKALVAYAADTMPEASAILRDILDTPISPELLPPDENGEIKQITEEFVGPYELHDFFLYYMLKYHFSPKKIVQLAETAFDGKYNIHEIKKWLGVFYRRFFSQQFKRSCLPDGPKICDISLSPRGDLKMPSDMYANIWLKELDEI